MSADRLRELTVNGIEDEILTALGLPELPEGLRDKIDNQVNEFVRQYREQVSRELSSDVQSAINKAIA